MWNSRKTAAELMAELQNDPEWVRQNAEREAKHKAAVQQLHKEVAPEQQPILEELLERGFRINSVWDFVNTNEDYKEVIPILTRHLQNVKHPALREGLARALTVPAALGVSGQVILNELKSGNDPIGSEARWALANALTVVADRSLHDEIRLLTKNPVFEDVRERLLNSSTAHPKCLHDEKC